MSNLTVIRTRILAGHWEGIVRPDKATATAPDIAVTLLGQEIKPLSLAPVSDSQDWALRIPIPADQIAEGVHTFLILDRATGETLDHFALIAGDALSEDLRTEMTLLRDELDMLKRAFRRHCLETA